MRYFKRGSDDLKNHLTPFFYCLYRLTPFRKISCRLLNRIPSEVHLKRLNGDNSWTLPMPGRFLIDQSGAIRAADVDPDYTIRTEPEDTLNALRALNAK